MCADSRAKRPLRHGPRLQVHPLAPENCPPSPEVAGAPLNPSPNRQKIVSRGSSMVVVVMVMVVMVVMVMMVMVVVVMMMVMVMMVMVVV